MTNSDYNKSTRGALIQTSLDRMNAKKESGKESSNQQLNAVSGKYPTEEMKYGLSCALVIARQPPPQPIRVDHRHPE